MQDVGCCWLGGVIGGVQRGHKRGWGQEQGTLGSPSDTMGTRGSQTSHGVPGIPAGPSHGIPLSMLDR